MLKEHAAVFRKLMMFFDLFVLSCSFCLAHFLRNKITFIYPFADYALLLPVFLLIWAGLFYFSGMYTSFRTKSVYDILFIVFKSSFLSFIILGGIIYILKLHYVSRGWLLLSIFTSAFFISIEKYILVYFFRRFREKGYNLRYVLIVGTGKRAQKFIKLLESHSEWGLKIIGLIDRDRAKKGVLVCGYKVLGAFEDIPDITHTNVIDEVVFVVPRSWLDEIENIIHFFESEGVKIHLALDYFNLKFSRAKQTDLHGFPLFTFESTPDKIWQLLIKRLFDILFSGIVLVVFSPFFLFIALAVKFTSEGPVLFRQERCGLNGRRFFIYKFRTMVKNAEEKLESLREYNEMQGPVFKMKEDPRLTKIGGILRKSSLDELPQFWNIFKGEMSLIGPRPPIPKEVGEYDSWQRRRLSMKPGLSCLWQIEGRNRIVDFDEWMKLDLEYIDNWSLWFDFKILFKTIPIVLLGIGAK